MAQAAPDVPGCSFRHAAMHTPLMLETIWSGHVSLYSLASIMRAFTTIALQAQPCSASTASAAWPLQSPSSAAPASAFGFPGLRRLTNADLRGFGDMLGGHAAPWLHRRHTLQSPSGLGRLPFQSPSSVAPASAFGLPGIRRLGCIAYTLFRAFPASGGLYHKR